MQNDINDFSKVSGMLLYVSVQEPAKAYVKQGAPEKPKEWKASVVLTDEDYVDELEKYAKKLDTQVSLKKVKSADFKEEYKVDPPEDAGKNVWVFTLRKSTELGSTKKPVPEQYRPRVFERQGSRLVDITNQKLVGNGSIGTISVDRFDRDKGGSSLYLKNVLVEELVEYVKPEGGETYEPGSEFSSADGGEGNAVKVPTKAAKTSSKPSKKTVEDSDESSPF